MPAKRQVSSVKARPLNPRASRIKAQLPALVCVRRENFWRQINAEWRRFLTIFLAAFFCLNLRPDSWLGPGPGLPSALRPPPSVLRPVFYVLLFFFLFAPPLQAQSPESLVEVMTVANQNYEAGRFADAVANYETLIEAGVESSAVYYNLGNAYFKEGDLGRAILNYRRAEALAPRDDDIAVNLQIARSQTVDRLDLDRGQPGLGEIVGQWFTLGEMYLLLLALWLLICIFICLAIMLPRWRKVWQGSITGAALLLLIGVIALLTHLYGAQQSPEAVVLVDEVEVVDAPGSPDETTIAFTLHAGAEVQLIERRLGWRHIALPGALEGWVPAETLALIEPPAGS